MMDSLPNEAVAKPSANPLPLVSIGMPVRNGGALFREALRSVVEQDYPNLEIIISDNGSTDETAAIALEFAAKDPRIRYLRQERVLGIFDNFRLVLDQARGDFFAWAAHDDTRSANFVSRLLTAFEDRRVVVALGDVKVRHGVGGPVVPTPFEFDNRHLSSPQRMRKQAFLQCYHMYGLWRVAFLKSVTWAFTPWWTDLPLLVTAAGMATFRHVPGTDFVYLEVHKTDAQRAAYQEMTAAPGRIVNVLRLMRAMTVTAFANLPPGLALLAVLLVVEREARGAFAWLGRQVGARRPADRTPAR
jgi:hypothetical protein